MTSHLHTLTTHPTYVQLVRTRRRLALALTAIITLAYFTFIALIAFQPALLGIPISGAITLGIPLGIGLIVLSFVLTGIYVHAANTRFDGLITRIRKDL